jgi:hypothetical protein
MLVHHWLTHRRYEEGLPQSTILIVWLENELAKYSIVKVSIKWFQTYVHTILNNACSYNQWCLNSKVKACIKMTASSESSLKLLMVQSNITDVHIHCVQWALLERGNVYMTAFSGFMKLGHLILCSHCYMLYIFLCSLMRGKIRFLEASKLKPMDM